MPTFSTRSESQLRSCDPRLQAVFREVIEHRDCTVIVGHRGREDQEAAFETGHSQKHWPDGAHNATPSRAADVAPYPIDWKDRERFALFAGFVLGIATSMGVSLRWGGDWSGDGRTSDEKLSDLVHFELKET